MDVFSSIHYNIKSPLYINNTFFADEIKGAGSVVSPPATDVPTNACWDVQPESRIIENQVITLN